jgi:glycosyl transferase family 25
MRIEGFVIHLARAVGRRPQVDELLRRLPVPTQVLDAIDGQALTEEDVASVYRRGLHQPHYPFALRRGEIACFLSHRKAWREIVDRDLEAGLVMEDDAGLDPGTFDAAFRLASDAVGNQPAYIQFGWKPIKSSAELVVRRGEQRIVRPEDVMLGTIGQLVTRSAAKKLLDCTGMFDRPIDVFLQMHWLTGVRPVAAVPSGVVDRTDASGGTTIHARKSWLERLSREWGRFIYRQRIRHLSRLHNGGANA